LSQSGNWIDSALRSLARRRRSRSASRRVKASDEFIELLIGHFGKIVGGKLDLNRFVYGSA
jgi:hypothetical protein